MRRAINALVVVAAVALAWSAVAVQRARSEDLSRETATRRALHRLTEAALMHGAVEQGQRRSAPRYPDRPLRSWFDEGDLPRNGLAEPGVAWVDIATREDAAMHPPDPVLLRDDTEHTFTNAAFWYHPGRGMFRARVPRQASDAATLRLYNRVNQTKLDRLPVSTNPKRADRFRTREMMKAESDTTSESAAVPHRPAAAVEPVASPPRERPRRPTLRSMRRGE